MPASLMDELKIGAIVRNYGGWPKIWRSIYARLAVVITLACWGTWTKADWWSLVLGVTPNLLGFTLSAFALLLAFGDERFRQFLAKAGGDGPGLLNELAATFLIFVVVQITALIGAVVCRGMFESNAKLLSAEFAHSLMYVAPLIWGLAFFVFVYGALLTVACARWIYILAVVYAHDLQRRKGDD